MREKILQALERYDLLDPGDRVLVAVSGGQDSLALLFALHDLSPELRVELVVGHLHHGMRGAEADADQQYVGELAAQLGLPYVTDRVDVPALAEAEHTGVEEAGRRARYQFLEQTARQHRCQKIALAHTATDRAETLLMNLFRGAGLHGMRSIPPRRGRIIRPLINVSRQETAEACRSIKVRVCTDSTNLERGPLRNRIRMELLPQLETEYGPGIEAALCRAAEHAWAELAWTEPLVEQAFGRAREDDGLSLTALRGLAPGLRQRVLRRFLGRAGHPLTDLPQERWEALETLIARGATGRRLELSHHLGVLVEYGVLRMVGTASAVGHDEVEATLTVPGQVDLPDGQRVVARLTTERPQAYPAARAPGAMLDADRAGSVLLVRRARPGDRFVPLGMTGAKKLQDFFVDNKVPPRGRRPWLVTRADGTVVWVVGHRLAETARVDDTTRSIVELSVFPAGDDAQVR